MSAKAISEASAKALLYAELSCENLSKNPFATVTQGAYDSPTEWTGNFSTFIAKPDALIKRRGKLNLLILNKSLHEVNNWIKDRCHTPVQIGNVTGTINRFLVEPFVPHETRDEYYVCIYAERDCNVILFHHQGGINVGNVDEKGNRYKIHISDILKREAASEPLCSVEELVQSNLLDGVQDDTRRRLLATFIVDLHRVFDQLHFTYLEINPLVLCPWSSSPSGAGHSLYIHILDVAAKLDQCAEFLFLANGRWSPGGRPVEFPMPFGRNQSPEEAYIAQLDAHTGASMKLSILNPNGRVWTMSAGGGASVIYADTVCELAERAKLVPGSTSLGARDLANYGEYSGAPSEGQTYEYAKTILSLMTRGTPHPEGKILLIGGGIANFTNVAATFKGIVRALTDYKSALLEHRVQVFVRRAGPNYQEGLRIMRELSATLGIPIHVFGPETHMTAIVAMALNMREIKETRSSPVKVCGLNGVSTLPHAAAQTEIPQLNGDASPQHDLPMLFTQRTKCIVWGLQTKAVQSMLDFDYVSNREQPSVACIVYPFGDARQIKVYWGSKELLLPVYKTLEVAMNRHPEARVLVNFGSLRVAYDVTIEAMQFDAKNENSDSPSVAHIQCVAIIAEGIPEKLTRRLIQRAKERGVLIIGPATVGGVKAGCFKIGNTGGMIDNILSSKLYRPGSVAYVSRSGGLSNELNNIICRNSDGVEEGIAIGGDRYPGSTFLDHLLRFEDNPNVGMMVMLGEVGGTEEYAVAEAVKSGRIRKPVVAWCIGTCAQLLSQSSGDVQFGHAGACAHSERETATAKNAALAAAGIHVPASFDELDQTIKAVFDNLVRTGRLVPKPDVTPRSVPLDYDWAKGWRCRPGGQLKTWLTTIKEDLEPLGLHVVHGLRRWERNWLDICADLAADRRAWNGVIRDAQRADSSLDGR